VGQQVSARTFSREDRQRYRRKVRAGLDVFARMLSEARFHPEGRSFGMEIELNLTDDAGDPAMVNAAALEAIADPSFQTELGQFNVEINIAPRLLEGRVFTQLEADARASLNHAEERARTVGAHMMIIGILPTIGAKHLHAESFSANPRYALLNEQIFAARGEDLEITIAGVERLSIHADTIAPEAACTSVQLHQQVEPETFASHWNAAQALAGVQVAVAANSPFFYGKELWRETRIALFEQATDTRPEELKVQGVRPRVWFGERWITSIFDLFEENVRYFPALLPVCEDEDPLETLERGDVPHLGELRLHNGTIYRWNRPIYDVVRDQPHLRVENRVLPAGPTVIDVLANGAFYYGLLRVMAEEERPVWSQMSFSAAEENFHASARDGIDARLYWPGLGEVPATELVLRRLLPLAHEGLSRAGVDSGDAERLLGIRRDAPQRRHLAERHLPSLLRGAGHGPPRGASPDDPALPRPYALKRAGARVGDGVTRESEPRRRDPRRLARRRHRAVHVHRRAVHARRRDVLDNI
jgi:gamma-glutamyl:cysteine ligase YbdK (ATP-grasp superfamily)